MSLLDLSRSRIRQLITLEGMPTDAVNAKLWYEANAKKNPSYKRGPAKHEEMLLAGACVEGGSAVVAVSSCYVNTGSLQHALGGISAARVQQLKTLGMPTESLDEAVMWRNNRITQSNHTARARTLQRISIIVPQISAQCKKTIFVELPISHGSPRVFETGAPQNFSPTKWKFSHFNPPINRTAATRHESVTSDSTPF